MYLDILTAAPFRCCWAAVFCFRVLCLPVLEPVTNRSYMSSIHTLRIRSPVRAALLVVCSCRAPLFELIQCFLVVFASVLLCYLLNVIKVTVKHKQAKRKDIDRHVVDPVTCSNVSSLALFDLLVECVAHFMYQLTLIQRTNRTDNTMSFTAVNAFVRSVCVRFLQCWNSLDLFVLDT